MEFPPLAATRWPEQHNPGLSRVPVPDGASRWLRYAGICILVLFGTSCGPPVTQQPIIPPTTTTVALPSPASVTSTPTPSGVVPTLGASPVPPLATPTLAASPTSMEPATIVAPSPTTVSATATMTATVADAAITSQSEVALEPFNPDLAAQLQGILNATVADGYIPGAVVAVNIPGQEPWIGASGFADPGQGRPMEPTTRFRIASISKIFTAVVVLQLVEEGRIDLDAPIATWLPDLVLPGETITVRQLLNHTSGLYDYLEDRNFRDQAYQNPERSWTPRELVEYAAQFPLSFPPGAEGAWDYSSTNYVVLGMLVEQVTGQSLANEMRQRIFEPLGLEATFFAPDEPIQGNQARGYGATDDLMNVPMSFAFATANLVSTVDDVQRFARALFYGQLLKAETRTMMYSFVNGKGAYNMPELEYGLGLMRNRLPIGPGPNGQPRPTAASTVLGHTGGFAGFRSVVWSAPESQITIALGLNQSDTDPNTLATAIFDAILTHQGR